MDLKIENDVEKQNELRKQIEELQDEKIQLQYKMNVLIDCLSIEKLEKKVSELANKQKILTFVESMLIKIKAEIQPLSYLKELLQRKLMITPLSTDDFNIMDQKVSESPVDFTEPANCADANETLDSYCDVNSENSSVMVLSDYDMVSDEEDFNDAVKGAANKVMYEEALQMATSVHLTSVESSTIVNEQDLLNYNGNDQNKLGLEYDKEKNGSTTQNVHLLSESSGNDGIKSLDFEEVDMPIMVDSWVKVESFDIFKNQVVEICQAQKDNRIPKVNTEVEVQFLNNKLNTHQLESKDLSEIKSLENVRRDITESKNDNHFLDCLNNISKDINAHSSSLETEDFTVSHECCASKVNLKDEMHIKDDKLCKRQFESRSDSEIKCLENVSNNVDNCYENYVPVCSTSEKEVDICSFIFNPGLFIVNNSLPANDTENVTSNSSDKNFMEFMAVSKKQNGSSVNVGERLSPISNNHYFKRAAVCRDSNQSLADLNEKLSAVNNVKHLMDTCLVEEFNVMSLKAKLLTGFHMHGFQDLKEYQKRCINQCINGNDVIYHSYPCVGKSTIGILSVLQKIDTSFNECQAIILVPTIELALCAQKVIKSLGKFLNVSTCVGSVDVLCKGSPVPHVVISTLQSLIEMINFNVLCTDFVNLFVIDDADELFNCIDFCNQIKLILLYLNKNCQLMIFSTSKIEEILHLFSDKLHNPEYIIKPEEKPNLGDIIQYQVDLDEEDKFDAICQLYEGLNLTHAVVYCNTWRTSKEISENMFLKFKFAVSAVHKTMDVGQRQFILQQFQSGIDKMLVTEGFQRGEEFPEVQWVINYDLPKSAKDYVRRIIGCFDKKIKVINFITTNDATAKTNIETAFNVHMLLLPQNMINSCVTNLD